MTINPGEIFKHYKGYFMEIDFVATNTESNEEMVIYHHINDTKRWVRPISMWLDEVVDKFGNTTHRFSKCEKINYIPENEHHTAISKDRSYIYRYAIDKKFVMVLETMKNVDNGENYIFYTFVEDDKNKIHVATEEEWTVPTINEDGKLMSRFSTPWED